MLMDHAQIAALIPHGESMCLLDEVISWDAAQLHSRSNHFATSTNPLFEDEQLDSILLIEYAAQAAAIHAALLHSGLGDKRPAYIGAVKNIELLEPIGNNHLPIDIQVECLLNNSSGAIYQISVLQSDKILLRGRLILNQP